MSSFHEDAVHELTESQYEMKQRKEDLEDEVIARWRAKYIRPWDTLHPVLPPCPPWGQQQVASLVDICLSVIVTQLVYLYTRPDWLRLNETIAKTIETKVGSLLPHLKERMLILVARGKTRSSIGDEVLCALYPKDQGPSSSASANTSTPLTTDNHRPHKWSFLDVSFARIEWQTMERLLLGPPPSAASGAPFPKKATTTLNENLRHLSIAYCTSATSPPHLPVQMLTWYEVTKPVLETLIHSVPLLEHLSLAGIQIHFAIGTPYQHPKPSFRGGRGANPFPWATLWRSCPKLRVLDLSYTSGLQSGAVGLIESVVRENETILPQLDQLLLKGSDAYLHWLCLDEHSASASDGRGAPLPDFLCSTHAHHWSPERLEERIETVERDIRRRVYRRLQVFLPVCPDERREMRSHPERWQTAGERAALACEPHGAPELVERDFTQEDVDSCGAVDVKHLAQLALLMDTFRGKIGVGAAKLSKRGEKRCEIWVDEKPVKKPQEANDDDD